MRIEEWLVPGVVCRAVVPKAESPDLYALHRTEPEKFLEAVERFVNGELARSRGIAPEDLPCPLIADEYTFEEGGEVSVMLTII